MEIINRLRLSIEGLDRQDFYKYIIIVLGLVCLVTGFILFRHYSKVWSLQDRLQNINDTREETIKPVLKRMNRLVQQRKQVDDILARDKDFKIAGYFKELLEKQNLTNKKTTESASEMMLANGYTEIALNVRFNQMNMKELCELLEKIEKNERVYAKNLEIIKSTKAPKTIEVGMTVATLQPKLKAGR